MYYTLVDFHMFTDTLVSKLISSFLIFTHAFLCTKLISNCALIVPLAINLPLASQFESD